MRKKRSIAPPGNYAFHAIGEKILLGSEPADVCPNGLGIIAAHYGVEGNGLYGIPLDQILPYSVTRTWHTQMAIFWIATAWLATGLYFAPAVSGKASKYQVFSLDFLFIALLIIVAGSMVGQWLRVMQKLNMVDNFWFGLQGYEYVDLGRFWQIFLFVGCLYGWH